MPSQNIAVNAWQPNLMATRFLLNFDMGAEPPICRIIFSIIAIFHKDLVQISFSLSSPTLRHYQFLLGWRGHPAPRLRRRPRRGATRSRTPTRRTRPRWRRTSMPRREIMRREARERLFFVSSSESRTTIQVNCELDLKSTANLTSSQVATSLQVKLGLHFYRHSDFTSSERERPLWGCFWGAWRGTCLEVVIGESVHKDRPCGRAER